MTRCIGSPFQTGSVRELTLPTERESKLALLQSIYQPRPKQQANPVLVQLIPDKIK